jgi:hypothetical protein
MQMSITDVDDDAEQASHPPARVGYGCPPVHSQFKPGQSGNPSGRAKGNQNLKTLFNKVLNEEISLRDGSDIKKISKAEAVVRSVVVGALKAILAMSQSCFDWQSRQDSSRTHPPTSRRSGASL